LDNRSVNRHTHTHTHIRTETKVIVYQMHFHRLSNKHYCVLPSRVYQMQPRNGQNWHSSVEKYVHHNRETAKIGFCTSLNQFLFQVSLILEIKSMQISFKSIRIFVMIRGKNMASAIGKLPKSEFAHL